MKGRSIPYSAEELAFIEWRQAMSRRALHREFVRRFNRPEVTVGHIAALCKRKGWTTGRTGCFEKGLQPHNKGKKCAPGRGGRHPNARRTQFHKGHLPHNTRYLGHERIAKDGYVEISVAETNPHTGFERRYVLKHRWLWEQANSPLPEGYVLKCLDGNKTNTDPSNWEAVPRALLPRLSGGRWYQPYEAYEPEVRPAVLTIAKLEHEAREAGHRLGGDES